MMPYSIEKYQRLGKKISLNNFKLFRRGKKIDDFFVDFYRCFSPKEILKIIINAELEGSRAPRT
jgi:hypothetical protein